MHHSRDQRFAVARQNDGMHSLPSRSSVSDYDKIEKLSFSVQPTLLLDSEGCLIGTCALTPENCFLKETGLHLPSCSGIAGYQLIH